MYLGTIRWHPCTSHQCPYLDRHLVQIVAGNHLRNPRLNRDGARVLVDDEAPVSHKGLVLQVFVLGIAALERVVCCWGEFYVSRVRDDGISTVRGIKLTRDAERECLGIGIARPHV